MPSSLRQVNAVRRPTSTVLWKPQRPRGGPRVGSRDPTGGARAAKCPWIRPINVGSLILAMTLTLPPRCAQVPISMPNTRFSRCARRIAWCRSVGVRGSIAGRAK